MIYVIGFHIILALPGLSIMIRRSLNQADMYASLARSSEGQMRSHKRNFMPSYQPLADMAADFAEYLSMFGDDYDDNYENSDYTFDTNPFSNDFLQ